MKLKSNRKLVILWYGGFGERLWGSRFLATVAKAKIATAAPTLLPAMEEPATLVSAGVVGWVL